MALVFDQQNIFPSQKSIIYTMFSTQITMSDIKEDMEDAGDKMKKGAKKTGNRMEEGAEEAKEKVDQ